MGQRCLISRELVGTSRDSPSALNTWPWVTSPTGTLIGAPVSVISAPRTTPSVGCSAIARTVSSPMCCATSRVNVLDSSPNATSVVSALYRSGIA
jgi:hypothetical protein